MEKYKYFFQKCLEQDNVTGDLVRIRIEGARSNLHAAEAKYQGFY